MKWEIDQTVNDTVGYGKIVNTEFYHPLVSAVVTRGMRVVMVTLLDADHNETTISMSYDGAEQFIDAIRGKLLTEVSSPSEKQESDS